ncbi:hypothetical protein Sango_2112600 [Sesamum angolense]|uniref:KIB1-4 beta-propeller domain-containing protein n=1 Tax=Sesamum angolense TaxID=2727404 RepID=A0AAE1WBT2_9LAMI|nr:hypothetical protein Sango_2112600 [Sesamum angolense]
MAQKTAKKIRNQPSSGKKATRPPSLYIWPNLPHQLMELLARQHSLMQNITSCGGVIKAWRSASPQCCSPDGKAQRPQLVEINGRRCVEHQKTVNGHRHGTEISFHKEYPDCYYKRRVYKKYYPGTRIQGYSHGKLVVMGSTGWYLFLWEPVRGFYGDLPPWNPNLSIKMCTLSSSPDDRKGCNLLVLMGARCAFFRWGKGERAWAMEDCTAKEPYAPSQYMQFINAIGFQGKFYALSLQGSLAVIEDVDSCFRITAIGDSRAVPSKLSRQFRELDIPKLSWVKVENLGDRTLFLEDECCMGVTASKVGCKKNCIYFSHRRVYDQWWVFDVESGSISPAFGTNVKIQESLM